MSAFLPDLSLWCLRREPGRGAGSRGESCGRHSLLDSVVKERGWGACATANDNVNASEAEAQFARRLIIGFGLTKTNQLVWSWGGRVL
jgi:hypothetical protein